MTPGPGSQGRLFLTLHWVVCSNSALICNFRNTGGARNQPVLDCDADMRFSWHCVQCLFLSFMEQSLLYPRPEGGAIWTKASNQGHWDNGKFLIARISMRYKSVLLFNPRHKSWDCNWWLVCRCHHHQVINSMLKSRSHFHFSVFFKLIYTIAFLIPVIKLKPRNLWIRMTFNPSIYPPYVYPWQPKFIIQLSTKHQARIAYH